MTDQLKQLSEAATQGEWTPDPFDDEVISFSKPLPKHLFPEADNVAFICALVNAYRAGELIPASEARAREAVAYEVAAKAAKQRMIVISDAQRSAFHSGNDVVGERHHAAQCAVGRVEEEIRALTPAHTTTALEQIKQQARDEGKRVKPLTWELIDDRHWGATCQSTGIGMEVRHVSLSFCRVRYGRGEWEPFENRPDVAKKEMERRYTAAILATLSADTQD